MKPRKPLLLLALLALSAIGAATIWAAPQTSAPAPAAQGGGTGTGTSTGTLSTAEIIRRFSENESQFRTERGNYTYTQSVLVEASNADGSQSGTYEMTSDIVFTPDGKRYEKVTYAPANTLKVIQLTPQDMKDLESIQPFVLTAEDLSKYNVNYDGKEKIDELDTYRFNVGPKKIEKDQRYFQGTIWVDDHDFAVVKSDGKAVPDIVEKGKQQNRFPRFVTYRENIEGNFWFPTYTRADDILHFEASRDSPANDVRIRMTVRYKNYKRFGSTVRVGPSKEIPATPEQPTR